MRNLVDGEKEWPIGLVWNHHDWLERGGQNPQSYKATIDERLGGSSSLEEFCAKAQFVNYESMRAIFEAWNANLWKDASGLLLWMSNPAWHSTVWQTYDYDLDVNGSYYGSRSGCEAHHVQADPQDWKVIAVNHTPETLRHAVVEAELLDLSGKRLAPSGRRSTFPLRDGTGLHGGRVRRRPSPAPAAAAPDPRRRPDAVGEHLLALRPAQGHAGAQ